MFEEKPIRDYGVTLPNGEKQTIESSIAIVAGVAVSVTTAKKGKQWAVFAWAHDSDASRHFAKQAIEEGFCEVSIIAVD